jgi:hypothetical protein
MHIQLLWETLKTDIKKEMGGYHEDGYSWLRSCPLVGFGYHQY